MFCACLITQLPYEMVVGVERTGASGLQRRAGKEPSDCKAATLVYTHRVHSFQQITSASTTRFSRSIPQFHAKSLSTSHRNTPSQGQDAQKSRYLPVPYRGAPKRWTRRGLASTYPARGMAEASLGPLTPIVLNQMLPRSIPPVSFPSFS
jgi:hypothetical protein